MNVLGKILEEIENLNYYPEGMGCGIEDCCITDRYEACEYGWYEAIEAVIEVIQNMEDGKTDNDWISVSEKLPEVGKMVKVTVHSSGWIADYDSAWVPEEEKTYHSEEYGVYDGYLSRTGEWRFYDDQYSENTCVKEFGTDKGTVYDVVTAWMPKEQIEPYKEG